MNYEQKYKELAGKIKKAYLYAQTDSTKAVLEDILPELKESEGERIRKELIDAIQGLWDNDALPLPLTVKRKDEWISWLEKLKVFAEHGDGLYYFRNNGFTYVDNPTWDNVSWLEKQEDKPQGKTALEAITEEKVGNANKVEPKFKVKYAGSEYNVLEIKEITGVTYYGIEDEPNHIDYVQAVNCEIISGYGIKENGSPYPTKPAVFSEQKPADKSEPKFKIGDWVVCKVTGSVHQIKASIENLSNHKYGYDLIYGGYIGSNHKYGYDLTYGGYIGSDEVNNYRLWSIEDAKPGDVLASGQVVFMFKMIHGVWLNCYCSLHNDGSFIADAYDLVTDKYFSEIHPATKEQRDRLFAKMKEEGYEWDAENKELINYNKKGGEK